jgi:hypothetical protein
VSETPSLAEAIVASGPDLVIASSSFLSNSAEEVLLAREFTGSLLVVPDLHLCSNVSKAAARALAAIRLAEVHAAVRGTGRAAESRSLPPTAPPPTPGQPKPEECAPLEICVPRREVRAGSRRMNLTTAQFDLLCHLAQHSGRVCSTRELNRTVLCADELGARARTHLAALRKRLGTQYDWIIETVRGRGYRLHEDARAWIHCT